MRMIDYVIALGDLIMPRACLACGRRLGMRERHLCLSCAADVPYTRFWLSAHNPLADRFNAVLERHRGTEPMDYAYAAALLYYKGAYRSIPRALKYQGDLAAGRHSRPPPLDPPPLPWLQPGRNPRPRPGRRLPLRPFSFPRCPCRLVLIRPVREMAGRGRP